MRYISKVQIKHHMEFQTITDSSNNLVIHFANQGDRKFVVAEVTLDGETTFVPSVNTNEYDPSTNNWDQTLVTVDSAREYFSFDEAIKFFAGN